MKENYSEFVDSLGGAKLKLNHDGAINPLRVESPTIRQVLNMSLEERVEWIAEQPVNVKKAFLKWRTKAEIECLTEEETRKAFTKIFKHVPNISIYNALKEAGFELGE